MRRLLLVAALAAAGPAMAPALAQVATPDPAMKALMAEGVNPAALAFWAGGNDPPENETPAAAAARWAAALQGAQALQAHGRALAAAPRPGRWGEFAQMMENAGRDGEAAARAKDAEKAFEIGGRLYDACDGCHKTYNPAPQRLP